MDEQQIVANLKQNIPAPTVHTPAPVAPASTDEPSSTAIVGPVIDEMTLYKLSNFFGQDYNPGNKELTEQVTFIYDVVSKSLGTNDYGFVTARIGELQRMLGINYSHQGDNLFHLWKWLQLDQRQLSIEAEKRALHA